MKFKIETNDHCYTVLAPINWTDTDQILEYYHTHDVFSVSKSIYEAITLIPKHAIQAILIEEDDE